MARPNSNCSLREQDPRASRVSFVARLALIHLAFLTFGGIFFALGDIGHAQPADNSGPGVVASNPPSTEASTQNLESQTVAPEEVREVVRLGNQLSRLIHRQRNGFEVNPQDFEAKRKFFETKFGDVMLRLQTESLLLKSGSDFEELKVQRKMREIDLGSVVVKNQEAPTGAERLADRLVEIETLRKSLFKIKSINRVIQILRIPFLKKIDPTKTWTGKNTAIDAISLEMGTQNQIQNDVSATKKLLQKGADQFVKFSHTFTLQFMTFEVAKLTMAIAQLKFAFATDPMAWDQFVKQITFENAAAFGVFSLVDTISHAALTGVLKGTLPKSMVRYVSMAVAMFATNVFSDMMNDRVLQECVSWSWFGKKPTAKDVCAKSFETWVGGEKIQQYTPMVTSLILSTLVADGIGKGLGHANLVVKGFGMMDEASYITKFGQGLNAASNALLTSVPVVMAGKMFLFLAIEHFVDPIIQNHFNRFSLKTFSIQAFFSKLFGHRDYRMADEIQDQFIGNVFDVKAKTLSETHHHLLNFLAWNEKFNWEPVLEKSNCIKLTKNRGEQTWNMTLEDGSQQTYTYWNKDKSDPQMDCEVLTSPEELLARSGELQRSWRQLLLKDFNPSFSAWREKLNGFMAQYTGFYNFGKFVSGAKFLYDLDIKEGQKSPALPVLSRTSIEKAIFNETDPTQDLEVFQDPADDSKGNSLSSALIAQAEEVNTGAKKTSDEKKQKSKRADIPFPKSLHNMMLTSVADFYVSAASCGGKDRQESVVSKAWKYFWSETGSDFVKISYGSSLNFEPPQLADEHSEVCTEKESGEFQKLVPNGRGVAEHIYKDLFKPKWRGADGSEHNSLAEYLFFNLSKAIYGEGTEEDPQLGFDNWFKANVRSDVEPVWNFYDTQFRTMFQETFAPVFFKRQIENGCSLLNPTKTNPFEILDAEGFLALTQQSDWLHAPKDSEWLCRDSVNELRVSNGIVQSIELEMRMYLRILKSLYLSFYDKTPTNREIAKKFYLSRANSLIHHIRSIQIERKFVNQSFENPALNELVTNVLTLLFNIENSPLNDPEKERSATDLARFNTAQYRIKVGRSLLMRIQSLYLELNESLANLNYFSLESQKEKALEYQAPVPKAPDTNRISI